jgi:hypothetical protein
MALSDSLTKVLSAPTAADLWQLRADLLEAGADPRSRVWSVLDEFHDFLDRIATTSSSRECSHLASKMDISAVGGVILEQVLDSEDADALAERLFSGLVSEGLMVAATRQHVKAWEGELAAVYRSAAWFLYGELWQWSCGRQPDLSPEQRRELIERLLAPVHAADTPGSHKAVLLGLLFQILLLTSLA